MRGLLLIAVCSVLGGSVACHCPTPTHFSPPCPSGTLRILVEDRYDGTPLPGARVAVWGEDEGPPVVRRTDRTGTIEFPFLPVGRRFCVEVEMDGFEKKRTCEVEVTRRRTEERTILLQERRAGPVFVPDETVEVR